VRELQNFVRRLAVFCNGPVVTETQMRLMDSPVQTSPAGSIGTETYKDAKERILDDFTRSYFHLLLEKTGGNVTHAARLSGLERVSLQKILKRFAIDAGGFRVKDE
jgi:DNA-binding NtrC family response regulator